MLRSRQDPYPYPRQARANVFQDAVPAIGGEGTVGLHPLSISVSGSTVTDSAPKIMGTEVVLSHDPSQGSGAQKS
jgi:hypothetical protein